MTSLGLSSTFDVTTFDQNRYLLCSTAGRGKDPFNDTQIRVIEKLRAKFLATARGYSMVKTAHLDNAFSEFFKLEAGPVDGQLLQPKDQFYAVA